MRILSSTAAQSNFGSLLSDVQAEPVTIEKNGKPSAVMMSAREYARLQELEDSFWAAKADAAATNGFLGVDATREFINTTLKNA